MGGERAQILCPFSLTPPSSCRAFTCPIKPQPHMNSTSRMTLWPFRELRPHHSYIFNSSSLKPKLERVKKLLQQTFGASPEAGKGQPTLTFHDMALWGRLHPSLPPSLPLAAPPGEAPQPHLPPGIPSRQQHLPVHPISFSTERIFRLMKSRVQEAAAKSLLQQGQRAARSTHLFVT